MMNRIFTMMFVIGVATSAAWCELCNLYGSTVEMVTCPGGVSDGGGVSDTIYEGALTRQRLQKLQQAGAGPNCIGGGTTEKSCLDRGLTSVCHDKALAIDELIEPAYCPIGPGASLIPCARWSIFRQHHFCITDLVEHCTNGKDDDEDGLVDCNDVYDCDCKPKPDSCPVPSGPPQDPPEIQFRKGEDRGEQCCPKTPPCEPAVGDPVEAFAGVLTIARADMNLPGLPPLQLQGEYRGRSEYLGHLGFGWSSILGVRLYHLSDGTYALRDEHGFKERFDAQGRNLTHRITPFDLAIRMDGSVRLGLQQDRSYLFDPDGALSRIVADDGSGWVFRYAMQNGAKIRLPIRGAARYAYPQGFYATISQDFRVDRIEHSQQASLYLAFTYNSQGMVSEVTNGAGGKVSYQYDTLGNLRRATDPSGGFRRYEYGDTTDVHAITSFHGQPIPPGAQDSVKTMVRHVFDEQGRVVRQDQGGTILSLTYSDEIVSVVSEPDNSGTWVPITYRTSSTVEERTAAGGTSSVITYLRRTRIRPNGSRTWIDSISEKFRSYDARGIASDLVLSSSIHFDTLGRDSLRVRPDGSLVSYSRDSVGRLLRQGEVPSTGPRRYERFDYEGSFTRVRRRVSGIVGGDSTVKIYTYNTDGQVLSERTLVNPGNDDSKYLETVHTYDASKRHLTVKDPAGNTTTYRYLSTSPWPDSVTFPDGKGERYTRDALGRVVATRNHLGGTRTTAFDGLGRDTLSCDELGVCTRSIYSGPSLIATEEGVRKVAGGYSAPLRKRRYEVDVYGHRVKEFLVTPGRDILKSKKLYDSFDNVLEEWDNPDSANTDSTRWRLVVRNRYDGRNRLVERRQFPQGIGSDSLVTRTVYDSLGHAKEVVDPRGAKTVRLHDSWGNVLRKTDALNRVVRHAYDHRNLLVADTNALGQVTRHEYDAMGNEVRRIGWLGDTTIRIYDKGLLAKERTPEGRWTTYLYDVRGRLQYSVQKVGDSARASDANDIVSQITYDALGRRSRETVAGRLVRRFGYDAAGRLVLDTNGLSKITIYVYDDLGRQTQARLPSSDTLITSYDAQGRVQMRILRSRQRVSDTLAIMRYDDADRPVWERTPGRGVVTTQYDATDYAVQTRDSVGLVTRFTQDRTGRDSIVSLAGAARRTVRDLAGRVTEQWDERGYKVGMGYDASDRLTSLVDNESNSTLFTYVDSLEGSRKRTTYPGSKTEDEIRDRDGLLRVFVDGRGVRRENTYDSLGRLVRAIYKKSGQTDTTATFGWDSWNNLIRAEVPGSLVEETFDALGRVLTSKQTIEGRAYSLTTSWDDVNRKRSLTLPDGSVRAQHWSARGQLDSLWIGGRLLSRFNYRNGLETGRILRNGISSTETYDAAGRLANHSYTGPAGAIGLSMLYDAAGNRSALLRSHATTRSEAMGYTTDRQLSVWKRGTANAAGTIAAPNAQESWVLDSRGNWAGWTRGATTQSRTPNGANELAQVGTESPTWDAAGNLQVQGTRSYAWDRRGLLGNALNNGAIGGTYRYDALGRRILKTVGTLKTDAIYDGWQPVYTVTKGGAVDTLKHLFYGSYIDEPVAMVRKWGSSSDSAYYLQGNNYNVEALTDRTGAIVERYEYTPYGEPTVYTGKGADGKWYTGDDVTGSKSSRGNDVLFQGRQIDWESGLYYYRNRQYSPSLGRFISRDPMRFEAGDANLYRFVGGKPSSSLDPFGLQELCCKKGKYTDEAGKSCCEEQAQNLDLIRFPKKTEGLAPGHIAIRLPNGHMYGWWPVKKLKNRDMYEYYTNTLREGRVENDDEFAPYATLDKRYKVCPETLSKVNTSLMTSKGYYQLGNRAGGHNCAGWALGVIQNAGLPMPNATCWPDQPGLGPGDL